VTNIAPNAEDSNLREFFSTAGEIERVRVIANGKTGRRAVIEFAHKEAVSAAVLLNGCLLLNHPLEIAECAYPVPEEFTTDSAPLSSFESKFAGFLGKTILAGKQAMAAVKDFDERNQITAKTKENLKAMDDKLQFTTSMKKIDEKAGLTQGVKQFSATASAQIKEIDKSLKITATTNAVVGIGKDAAGAAMNKAMENKVISGATNTMLSGVSSVTSKAKAVSAEAKATVYAATPQGEESPQDDASPSPTSAEPVA